MKMISNAKGWKSWIEEEGGRFSSTDYAPPKSYPCFAYMKLESWREEKLEPVYLYKHTLDEMSMQLLAAFRF
jgi:hypothetical protein